MVFVCTSLVASAMSVSNPSPTLSITISTSKAIYKLGELIHLDIVYSNPTITPIGVWAAPGANRAELYDEVTVSRSGKSLKPSAYEQAAQSHNMVIVSRIQYKVFAGSDVKDGMTLNKLFDLDKPGKYTIQVKGRDTGHETAASTSNVAIFEVK